MEKSRVQDEVRKYVEENFLYARPGYSLADDADLLAEGIIDSMGIVELVGFLESEFDLQIYDDEISEPNLGSVRAIADFIERKGIVQQ